MLGRIPETYDVRKVVEALIQELVKEEVRWILLLKKENQNHKQANMQQKY